MKKSLLVLASIFVLSCGDNKKEAAKTDHQETEINNMNKENTVNELEKFRVIFENKIVVLLDKKGTNLKTNAVSFQTYINEKNIEFIPVFTSNDKVLESTGGVVLGNEMELDGFLFLSQSSSAKEVNVLRINPALSDDTYVDLNELKKYFAKEIKQKTEELKINIE
ncbi:hypothetical protein [Flavobacterium sp. Root420]|uniref:hypothetical protein n=1 Tax=Flavobacterium sp. Root420 TaxID=1736533 RepID=UPI0006FB2EA4|nr:hypothetical protein [Flavobacterium sp. Root420]KQW99356.1 hypothetical protein ASC72_09755 [Flavobacterium sp. Root420]